MLTFLEARKVLANFPGGPPLRMLAAMSGTPDVLDFYLKAVAAGRGRSAEVRALPFNTLGQHLLGEPDADEVEVFALLPWDLVVETDWRSGVAGAHDPAMLQERALKTIDRLQRRAGAHVIYVRAPLPPLFPNPRDDEAFEHWMAATMGAAGATVLPSSLFSMGSYLSSGNPFSGSGVAEVAEQMIDVALAATQEPHKVLVTDLDGVMWAGVIGEDGLSGIRYGPEGVGYRHFLYQGLLAKLRSEGTLLAAVSRNDPELANGPFETGDMTLSKDDLIAIMASYNAKSAQISHLASELNLGLDSFVFVDDNPIELEEVGTQLPAVRCVPFPASDDALPGFLREVADLFARNVVTAEDGERTEMYRRRLEGLAISDVEGADLGDFLRDLSMSLKINDRTTGDRTRVVQLINKTNQFNLNGRRLSDDDVGAVLDAGGRLFGVEMTDRAGSHGEILSLLVDADHVVRSFVMSCRVFQRRVEFAFLLWLSEHGVRVDSFDFLETPRNEPIRRFLDGAGFGTPTDGLVTYDRAAFSEAHPGDLELFSVTEPQEADAVR